MKNIYLYYQFHHLYQSIISNKDIVLKSFYFENKFSLYITSSKYKKLSIF